MTGRSYRLEWVRERKSAALQKSHGRRSAKQAAAMTAELLKKRKSPKLPRRRRNRALVERLLPASSAKAARKRCETWGLLGYWA